MGKPTRTEWIVGGISLLVLPVATNLVSELVPHSWRPWPWVVVPLTGMLTVVVILMTRRDRPATTDGRSVQYNQASGGSTIYAAQQGDVVVDGDHERNR